MNDHEEVSIIKAFEANMISLRVRNPTSVKNLLNLASKDEVHQTSTDSKLLQASDHVEEEDLADLNEIKPPLP